jgi:catechol 2,3-dioxygenase-like lactoylglutathione lyase family enzyme
LLAELLDVPWADSVLGIFSAVYLNDTTTLDFMQVEDEFPMLHFCFRVDDADFDAILARLHARGIEYRSTVHGPTDMRFNRQVGGRGVYWNAPDGHQWEMLTASYARRLK